MLPNYILPFYDKKNWLITKITLVRFLQKKSCKKFQKPSIKGIIPLTSST
jgi:hypothetical protein